MRAKRILVLAIVINLGLLMAYLQTHPGYAVADDEPQPRVALPAEDTPAGDQWELLRAREEEMKVREVELRELEVAVEAKIKRLETLQASIQQEIDAYRVESNERVRHLVKIYSSMKPKAAADLMNNMDLNVAVQVFLDMKGEIAGGILSYMDTKKAALITKRLADYRSSSVTQNP